jgi:hypothetical protein
MSASLITRPGLFLSVDGDFLNDVYISFAVCNGWITWIKRGIVGIMNGKPAVARAMRKARTKPWSSKLPEEDNSGRSKESMRPGVCESKRVSLNRRRKARMERLVDEAEGPKFLWIAF